ncbi:hypothetical protein B0H13DRAFT_1916133 [Mycena leptocephala]|nr:hypothetical protein B0H13DRAFT_1916133 [Mycena leptocephala]
MTLQANLIAERWDTIVFPFADIWTSILAGLHRQDIDLWNLAPQSDMTLAFPAKVTDLLSNSVIFAWKQDYGQTFRLNTTNILTISSVTQDSESCILCTTVVYAIPDQAHRFPGTNASNSTCNGVHKRVSMIPSHYIILVWLIHIIFAALPHSKWAIFL